MKIIEPNPPLPDYQFESLPKNTSSAIKELGWKSLLPVQIKTIPYVLNAQDIIVQAKTGSGKTAAFAIPLLQVLEKTIQKPQALILVPTRELASQVTQEIQKVSKYESVKCCAIYGGIGYAAQIKALKNGVHIVVGTPGRILDHLIKGHLNLEYIRDLILDEADEMLSMGFYPDMKRIQHYLPKDRCTYMFSATMPINVLRLSKEFLRKPKFLNLCPSESSVAEMDRLYYSVDSMEKDQALLNILEVENPKSAIIFCNTKKNVQYLTDFLSERGFPSGMISGNLSQPAREKIMKATKQKKIRFLVATDLAARGIDIKNLSHVIIYDHPEDSEIYIHRSGRTARAGNKGIAISLVNSLEEIELKKIGKQYGLSFIQRHLYEDAKLAALIRERTAIMLEQDLRDAKNHKFDSAKRMAPLLEELMASEEQKLTIGMLLHNYYWKNFTKPKSY